MPPYPPASPWHILDTVPAAHPGRATSLQAFVFHLSGDLGADFIPAGAA